MMIVSLNVWHGKRRYVGGWCRADVTKGQGLSVYVLKCWFTHSLSPPFFLFFLIQACDIYDDIQYILKDIGAFKMWKQV